ncbi:MAG: hypothetical protein LBE81_09965, partial [Azonexus sp.]|nr:hypothetical protein [Azonexus sp.]
QPPVNSLWLWGGGALVRPQSTHFTSVWGEHPLAIGLARASGTPAHPLPAAGLAGFAGLAQLASPGSAPLVVLDSLLPPVLYEDGEAWRNAWRALEAEWFAPLRQQLGRVVSALDIAAPTRYGDLQWSLRSGDRWKFWRPEHTLAALISQFSGQFSESSP